MLDSFRVYGPCHPHVSTEYQPALDYQPSRRHILQLVRLLAGENVVMLSETCGVVIGLYA